MSVMPSAPRRKTTASSPTRRRRLTAKSMAANQRDISVSEFFAKNRHLLGFDNPRKAMLTTVKEAVDNSLDACEEAGILPEIWVHIEEVKNHRFSVAVQDNGPGIVKKQIPLIFGKLLYGSKFHRLRMSRGQQGIGISAAGMYGMLTTGQPVKITSKVKKREFHYYEVQIDTKTNNPEILNGRGEGVDISSRNRERDFAKLSINWVSFYDPVDEQTEPAEVMTGTRVKIELEGRHQRGRGSVDDYLAQTAIANPHVTLHFHDADGAERVFRRSTDQLPVEPREIKPHPYGVELGRLVTMIKDVKEGTIAQFLTGSFSRVSAAVARKICAQAKVSTRATVRKINQDDVESIYDAIQLTKIKNPSTDCISPIGEELLIKGLHQVVPGEFYTAATRPPAVYRGNPFQIEVALAYGGGTTVQKVSLELLERMIRESDARTLRQFLLNTFDGMGNGAAEKILAEASFGSRQSPAKLKPKQMADLHEAMKNVNVADRQSMQVLRYANRVPLQFKQRDCAITQAIMNTNWRPYGLSQSRGSLPSGPITVMIHMASVWVPFTSESKEAIAAYPEIEKELRLSIQAVGRKLKMYLRRRQNVKKQSDRRSVFQRYLQEVAGAVNEINGTNQQALYNKLVKVAERVTAAADIRMNDRGKVVAEEEYGQNVLIVDQDIDQLLGPEEGNGQSRLFE
jgi:DNA topoisomerase-6 subunit B